MVRKKAIICSLLFALLLISAWILNDQMIEHRYKHLYPRTAGDIHILHNESIQPFKPREYTKIIRFIQQEE